LLYILGLSLIHTKTIEAEQEALSPTLIIETDTIPQLYPHEHELDDSVLDPKHHIVTLSNPITLKEDTWVRGFEVVLKNAPEPMLHHAQLFRLDGQDSICPNYRKQEIFTLGPEDLYSPITLPAPYGIWNLLTQGYSFIVLGYVSQSSAAPWARQDL